MKKEPRFTKMLRCMHIVGKYSIKYPLKYETRVLDNYEITMNGRVFCKNYRNRGIYMELSQFDNEGYRMVNLSIDGKEVATCVHRLVMWTFIGMPPQDHGYVVDHLNCKKYDNRLCNLEWVTYSENVNRAIKNGLLIPITSETNPCAIITLDEAYEIGRLLEENKLTMDEIADMFNITKSTVSNIKTGYSWKIVKERYDTDRHTVKPKRKSRKGIVYTDKLNPDQVIEICEILANTEMSLVEISNMLNVPKHKIESILYGIAWRKYSDMYDFSHRRKYHGQQQYRYKKKEA